MATVFAEPGAQFHFAKATTVFVKRKGGEWGWTGWRGFGRVGGMGVRGGRGAAGCWKGENSAQVLRKDHKSRAHRPLVVHDIGNVVTVLALSLGCRRALSRFLRKPKPGTGRMPSHIVVMYVRARPQRRGGGGHRQLQRAFPPPCRLGHARVFSHKRALAALRMQIPCAAKWIQLCAPVTAPLA